MVPTRVVYTPFGKFFFTLEEFEQMRKMSQAELIEKVAGDFGLPDEDCPALSRDQVIYVVNKLQATFITEELIPR